MEGADEAGDGSGDRACTAIQTEVSELHHEDHCEPLEKHESQAQGGWVCALLQISPGALAAEDRQEVGRTLVKRFR